MPRPVNSTAIGLGLVGCGGIARAVHLPVLRRLRGARLVAVSDPDPEARAHAARTGGVPVLAEAGELLARADVDAVVVCAPTPAHAALAEAVAQAGRHLYLEKPVAASLPEARRAVAAVSAAGVTAVAGFNHRCHPLHGEARRLLRAGAIGRVTAVQSYFGEPAAKLPEWKRDRATGGGVLLDLASHHVDTLRWLLEDEVSEVAAVVSSMQSEADVASLRLRTQGGVEAQLHCSLRSARGDRIALVGDRGVLVLDRYAPWVELLLSRDPEVRAVRRRRSPAPLRPAGWRLRRIVRPAHEPSYRRSLQAFVDLLRGQPRELATLDDGLRSLAVVIAAERAAAERRTVAVEA